MNVETLMIIFIIVEAVQMFGILWNTRKTNQLIRDLMSDPAVGGAILSEGVHGFIKALVDDEEKQKTFFGFIRVCTLNAVETLKHPAVEGITGQSGAVNVDIVGMIKQIAIQKLTGMLTAPGGGQSDRPGGW